ERASRRQPTTALQSSDRGLSCIHASGDLNLSDTCTYAHVAHSESQYGIYHNCYETVSGVMEDRRDQTRRISIEPARSPPVSCLLLRPPGSPPFHHSAAHPRSPPPSVKNPSGSARLSSNAAAVSGPPITAAVSRLRRRRRRSGAPVRSGVWPCTMKRPQSISSQ